VSFLNQQQIKNLYRRVETDSDNTGTVFVHFVDRQ